MFSSAVVEVTPSSRFSSAAVEVTANAAQLQGGEVTGTQGQQVASRVVGDATVSEDSFSSCAGVVVSNEGHVVSGVSIAGDRFGAIGNSRTSGEQLQQRSPGLGGRL